RGGPGSFDNKVREAGWAQRLSQWTGRYHVSNGQVVDRRHRRAGSSEEFEHGAPATRGPYLGWAKRNGHIGLRPRTKPEDPTFSTASVNNRPAHASSQQRYRPVACVMRAFGRAKMYRRGQAAAFTSLSENRAKESARRRKPMRHGWLPPLVISIASLIGWP